MTKRHQWTPQEDQLIKDMRDAGYSFGIIADKLKGVSRNSVIGRARRLGVLSNMAIPEKRKAYGRKPSGKSRPRPTRVGRSPKPRLVANTKPAPISPPNVDPVHFLEAAPNQCRWPVGRWETDADCPLDEKHVCGGPAVSMSWCEYHLDKGTNEPRGRFADENTRAA